LKARCPVLARRGDRGVRLSACGIVDRLKMNLSAELFQSAVQALRAEETKDRADPNLCPLCARRVRLGGRALLIPCSGQSAGVPVQAIAQNISPSGISLTLPLRLVHGDRFILHLPRPCGCLVGAVPDSSILCTVARYQHAGRALFTLGATFTRVIRKFPHGHKLVPLPCPGVFLSLHPGRSLQARSAVSGKLTGLSVASAPSRSRLVNTSHCQC
jgi:hypothetical protein